MSFIGAQDEQGWQQGKEQCYLVDKKGHKIAQSNGQPSLPLFFRRDDDGTGLCHDDDQQGQKEDVLAAVEVRVFNEECQQGWGEE